MGKWVRSGWYGVGKKWQVAVADTGGGGQGGLPPPPPHTHTHTHDTQKKFFRLCTVDPACIGCSDTEKKL